VHDAVHDACVTEHWHPTKSPDIQILRKGFPVEIKIGVQNVAREIVLESVQSAEEIEALVTTALAEGGLLNLVDDSGRRVIVPVATIGYVDLGATKKGSVGFGTI